MRPPIRHVGVSAFAGFFQPRNSDTTYHATNNTNNATPTQDEARLCSPYLFEQIEAIGPEAIVTLGLPATRLLLDSVESMSRLRGLWQEQRQPEEP